VLISGTWRNMDFIFKKLNKYSLCPLLRDSLSLDIFSVNEISCCSATRCSPCHQKHQPFSLLSQSNVFHHRWYQRSSTGNNPGPVPSISNPHGLIFSRLVFFFIIVISQEVSSPNFCVHYLYLSFYSYSQNSVIFF
jgi:hypothetical protein